MEHRHGKLSIFVRSGYFKLTLVEGLYLDKSSASPLSDNTLAPKNVEVS